MAKHRKVPKGVDCSAEATIVGVIDKQPLPKELPGKRGLFCEVKLQVKGQVFPVFCCKEVAEDAGEIPGGSAVLAVGDLKQIAYETGERKGRTRTVLTARKIQAIKPPDSWYKIGEDRE